MFPKLMSLDETLLDMEMVENRCDRRDEVSLWLPRSGHLLNSKRWVAKRLDKHMK